MISYYHLNDVWMTKTERIVKILIYETSNPFNCKSIYWLSALAHSHLLLMAQFSFGFVSFHGYSTKCERKGKRESKERKRNNHTTGEWLCSDAQHFRWNIMVKNIITAKRVFMFSFRCFLPFLDWNLLGSKLLTVRTFFPLVISNQEERGGKNEVEIKSTPMSLASWLWNDEHTWRH